MCKEMPVILVNKVVDKKRIIGKKKGRGGGKEHGVVAHPPKKEGLLFYIHIGMYIHTYIHTYYVNLTKDGLGHNFVNFWRPLGDF
jgi:hypothetical protein